MKLFLINGLRIQRLVQYLLILVTIHQMKPTNLLIYLYSMVTCYYVCYHC
ncbi:unnamed protein product [Schistosoma curassoni]|uniref:Uncharacterized protein n=1 Tax=Schistosoma curassoni TaxID=6186 RepID=A0A183L1Z5_9TREM|nr:unnamed protein product [Schistosoma curassoni]